ncbi:YybH family protein [Phenylobacterium immobile]|uniref:YybH family protein n=1 Tax=Phenylobacterium immobile TaxID=21 RepID=UPI000AE16F79|nr:nuclear transport factor 2 family protein [Phenylobacterium immobile]
MQAAEQMIDRYVAAVLAKDVAGLAALYSPDVVVFDAWAAWRYDGLLAWRPALERWLGGLGDERVIVTFDGVQAHSVGEAVVVSAIVRYAGVSPTGAALRAIENRLTWLLIGDHAEWRIAHEHTSSPLHADTAAPMFERSTG